MKTKVILASLFLALSFNSCKEGETAQKSFKDNFSVIIDGIFTKNDKLQVYYLIKGKTWNEDNSVLRPIYGSNDMQQVEIDLPKGVIPANIRVDLGSNSTQSYVTIKNISVKYKSKEINGDLDNFNRYFWQNEYVTWDPDYFGLKLSKINNAYDPYMMGNELLIAKLIKISE
jgi:hypothetical protein